MRKTIKAEELVNEVNSNLSSSNYSIVEKRVLCFFLENILINNDCYGGFEFLKGNPDNMSDISYWERIYFIKKK